MAKSNSTTKKRAAAKSRATKGKQQRGATHAHLRDLAGATALAAEHATPRTPETPAALEAAVPPATAAAALRTAVPIQELLHDAKALVIKAQSVGRKLVAAGLDERYLRELPLRIAVLADAQRAWEKLNEHSTPVALKAAREAAAELRTDVVAAGRFHLRHDIAAQRALDAIVAGAGLADLIDDLRKLAAFYTEHAAGLADADLPANVAARAEELATQLTVGLAGEHDVAAKQATANRNRALALLDEAVREVRAAGWFVFRTAPARLALFRLEFRRAQRHRAARHHA